MLNVAKLEKGRQQLPAFDADAVWWHTEQLSKAGSRESAPSFVAQEGAAYTEYPGNTCGHC